MNTYFQLYANCILVKGANRATICDLQREEVFILPNEIADIINELNSKVSIDLIKKKHKEKDQKIIDEALFFLKEKEFGFYCDLEDFNLFPKLETSYNNTNKINDIILELEDFNIERLYKIVNIIKSTSSKSIHFVLYFPLKEIEIIKILELFKVKSLSSIEIITKHTELYNCSFLNRLKLINPRLKKITLFNSPTSEKINVDFFYVNQIKETFLDFSFCGTISEKYLTLNQTKFLESVNFNSCLNQKLAIDKKGNIKNCPVLPNTFGNIENLIPSNFEKEIILSSRFTDKWKITKDEIEECKDCEFRHVCTDCRGFIEDPKNPLSKPLKCGYSPYTNEWSEWSSNPIKKNAKEFYNL
ncbi:grasp-with-spasm system SPASM domain peptide maturase [Tenacibaculum ovolyticum]|uniref:grasp-with-spasm system SPASM domain peptide maturase n=1 Tax=Tenacibaculum ovolyticum TaxID=104270 RepID=UPI0007ED177A|nr:grasp-with-spasm system SPASM domain peptide maturase [Tenacibaculum ovolyticum]